MEQKPLNCLHCVVEKLQPKYIFPRKYGFHLITTLTVNVTIH